LGNEFHYEIAANQEAGALHVVRKMNVNGVLYPVDNYRDIRGFYTMAKSSDEQQVVLQSAGSSN
jgi:hypothetical protein